VHRSRCCTPTPVAIEERKKERKIGKQKKGKEKKNKEEEKK
jgi:hypothetical protein